MLKSKAVLLVNKFGITTFQAYGWQYKTAIAISTDIQ